MADFLIPEQNLSKLTVDIAALAKKANKLGVAAPVMVIGEVVMVEKKIPSPAGGAPTIVFKKYINVTVTGNAPVLNGWSFVGVIEPMDGAGSILRSIPGSIIPDSFRTVNPCKCDHCMVNRYRTNTFIVANGTEFKQVGRSCLKDFLGHDNPESIANYAQFLASFDFNDYQDENLGGGHSSIDYLNTIDIISAAINSIKATGYQKSDSDNPTKMTVASHFYSRKNEDRLIITEEDKEQAVKAVEYLKALEGSEFALNTAAYAAQDQVSHKAFGYLCAGAMMYLKQVENLKVIQSKKDGINSNPIGTEGDKVKLECTIISAHKYSRPSFHYYDSGVSQVLILKTADNKLIKMFSSNTSITEGDIVTVSGKLGVAEIETFEKSPYKGIIINTMMPRTRIIA